MQTDTFQTKATLAIGGKQHEYYSLKKLPSRETVEKLPVSLGILLENLLRHEDGVGVTRQMIEALLAWDPSGPGTMEIAFMPARVLLQDFTGLPCAVDLAAMRDAMVRMGGDPQKINPLQPVDLVIDHSVQVDRFGSAGAFAYNSNKEYERNAERYRFLRWSQQALRNFRVVPPETGIVHQVNLEFLAKVVITADRAGRPTVYPDTVFGTDSHTTMINGLGVLGWGVGGIEAEAAMLGQPSSMLIPRVVGFRLYGALRPSATATDLVLRVTEILRKKGVVGKFVEFFGAGIASLSLADRATIANMAPEYGATMGYFPVDAETLAYLKFTGRDRATLGMIEAYYREQGLFYDANSPDRTYSEVIELDLGTVAASIAGPKRPQDRVELTDSKKSFRSSLVRMLEAKGTAVGKPAAEQWIAESVSPAAKGGTRPDFLKDVPVRDGGSEYVISHGSVVIAAITSCTNTSNPSVMIAAGLLAKKAVGKGLSRKPWVKTSLAPGSKVVTEYLRASGLDEPLNKLGFNLVGYGCTTCIGNSGPLPDGISRAVQDNDLVVVSVLSGNRNFEGRINQHVRANYLASPPLVVAYALAGTMDIDLGRDPIGTGSDGSPVFLKDLWPSPGEVTAALNGSLKSEMFVGVYRGVFEGDEAWKSLAAPGGERFDWDEKSTYIRPAPFFEGMSKTPGPLTDITGLRVLAMLGDSVTTDHISPAGSIQASGPAGKYLIARSVDPADFNSYGSRRGNHEIMMRGTFANIRLRNLLVPGKEGGVTIHPDSPEPVSIFDAAMKYRSSGTPLMIIAGREYGSGSSRDWAAKGPRLLGVRAVLAESYERIHRSNLIGMGILPLQFRDGVNRSTLGLTGFETYDVRGISDQITPGTTLSVSVRGANGREKSFEVLCRLDTPMEVEYYRHDGILRYVLRGLLTR
ncbi:MAG TPA: aconitate hydratase AcnA [Bacteroidota bacterium]|nr:aconitate hydratase AcnA [Bacteroidota bacterium]